MITLKETFNRNKFKISYSCMQNNLNMMVLHKRCKIKEICPFGWSSFTSNIDYQARMFLLDSKSFNHKFFANNREQTKENSKIKMINFTPKITWSIVRKQLSYNLSRRKWNLCLNAKLQS